MHKKYYFPFNTQNLTFYLSSGCIAPHIYYDNKREDLQSKCVGKLLLTNQPFTESTNCSFELVLLEGENVNKISKNFFSFDTPLPISRIRAIIFDDMERCKTTVANVNDIGKSAHINKNLVTVRSNQKKLSEKGVKFPTALSYKDWSFELMQYDKLLGGLAMIRLGELDYSDEYYNLLGELNVEIREDKDTAESIKYKKLLKRNGKDDIYFDLCYNFNQLSGEEVVNNIAKVTEKNAKRNEFDEYVLPNEVNFLYLAMVFATYGDSLGNTRSIDSFIANIGKGQKNNTSLFKRDKREGIAISFGLNKGYKIFKSCYSIGNEYFNVKFKLDTRIDYYTIESVYEHVFNKEESNYFAHIESLELPDLPEYEEDFVFSLEDFTGALLTPLKNLLGRFYEKQIKTLFEKIEGLKGEKKSLTKKLSKTERELRKEKKKNIELEIKLRDFNKDSKVDDSNTKIPAGTQLVILDTLSTNEKSQKDGKSQKDEKFITTKNNNKSRKEREKELKKLDRKKLLEEADTLEVKYYTRQGSDAIIENILDKEFGNS